MDMNKELKNEEELYECIGCGTTFDLYNTLVDHVTTVHRYDRDLGWGKEELND